MSPLSKFAVSAAATIAFTAPALAQTSDLITITTEANGIRTAIIDAGLYDLSEDSERVRLDGALQKAAYNVCAQPHMNDRMSGVKAGSCQSGALRGARQQVAQLLESGVSTAQLSIQVAAR